MTKYKSRRGVIKSDLKVVGNYLDLWSVTSVLDVVSRLPESGISVRKNYSAPGLHGGEFFMQYAVGNATLIMKPSSLEKIGSEAKVVSQLMAFKQEDIDDAYNLLGQALCRYHVHQMMNNPVEMARIRGIMTRSNKA